MTKRLWIGTGLILSVWSGQLFASPPREIRQTVELSEPIQEAIRLRRADEANRILLVFDIDNTLLTMPQFLGSDRWFNYHADLIAKGADAEFPDINALIATQALLFGIGQMELTQPDAPTLIDEARKAGIQVMLLTARGPDFSNMTERELHRNGIDLDAPAVCAFFFCSEDGQFDAASVKQALQYIGSSAASGSTRPIAVSGGAMFAAGQNKGVMLQLLVSALQREKLTQVIFVDDGKRNVDAVAASELAVPLTIYHYTRVPTAVSSAEISTGKRQLRQLLAAICGTLKSSTCPTETAEPKPVAGAPK